jgi:uncharacterized protein YlxW (UPF0749 family)
MPIFNDPHLISTSTINSISTSTSSHYSSVPLSQDKELYDRRTETEVGRADAQLLQQELSQKQTELKNLHAALKQLQVLIAVSRRTVQGFCPLLFVTTGISNYQP